MTGSAPSSGAPAMVTCLGCGSPLKPGIKYCGTCGAPVPQAPPPTPTNCPQCGNAVDRGAQFCGRCGAEIAGAQPAHAGGYPPSVQPAEPVLALLSQLARRKGLLSAQEYILAVTAQRLVFARITSRMIQDAAMQAKTMARDQGKGFMGQWGAVIGARQHICERYWQMSAESILAEDPESFSVPLQQVREIRTKSESDADDNTTELLEIQTTTSKLRFTLAATSAGDARKALKQILGDLVR
jgi:hypothetical protein